LAPLALIFVLAGCARSGDETAPPAPGASAPAAGGETATVDNVLAGTSWLLVEFQSMDDATGAVRPEASQRFTMRLDSDGSVSMELDCNRATGTWTAEPSEDGQSGRFEFGPLAVTRALGYLKRSPLAIDLYVWLTYRMSYLRKGTLVPRMSLEEQFGADSRPRDFRESVLIHFIEVLLVYPAVRASLP
jgi:heat shock protein HslJ